MLPNNSVTKCWKLPETDNKVYWKKLHSSEVSNLQDRWSLTWVKDKGTSGPCSSPEMYVSQFEHVKIQIEKNKPHYNPYIKVVTSFYNQSDLLHAIKLWLSFGTCYSMRIINSTNSTLHFYFDGTNDPLRHTIISLFPSYVKSHIIDQLKEPDHFLYLAVHSPAPFSNIIVCYDSDTDVFIQYKAL